EPEIVLVAAQAEEIAVGDGNVRADLLVGRIVAAADGRAEISPAEVEGSQCLHLDVAADAVPVHVGGERLVNFDGTGRTGQRSVFSFGTGRTERAEPFNVQFSVSERAERVNIQNGPNGSTFS